MRVAKPIITIVVAALMIVLVTLHTPSINGPSYWRWEWRALPAGPVYLVLAIAALPLFAGQVVYRATQSRTWVAILLLMIGCFAMKLGSVAIRTDPPSLQLVDTIVTHPDATSYFTDAQRFRHLSAHNFLAIYSELMPTFNLHSMTKPPGPILYWRWILDLVGENSAPRIGGLILGALATLSIPATFLLLRFLLCDPDAAFAGASFLSLSPGFVLFFPMFDPVYILLSCALIGLWAKATTDASAVAAAGMGLVLALTLFVTFNVLVIGLFCALYPIVVRRASLRQYLTSGAIVLVTTAVTLGILAAVAGYSPISTFRSAWINQHALLAKYADQRPYPSTIFFDLADFALGSGWISVILAIFYFCSGRDHRALVYLCLGQLLLVALTGLLQAETARVWNFMLPLLMIPVGLELARWPLRDRMVVLAGLLLVTSAICQNMKFIY